MISHFARSAADFSRPSLYRLLPRYLGGVAKAGGPTKRPFYSGDSSGLGDGGTAGKAGEVIVGGDIELLSAGAL